MKKSRFTESQIAAVLKEAETSVPVNEVCRKHGISDATYYNGKSNYGGMEVSDLRRIAEQSGMTVRYIEPGRPNRSAYVERFNSTQRKQELLLDIQHNVKYNNRQDEYVAENFKFNKEGLDREASVHP